MFLQTLQAAEEIQKSSGEALPMEVEYQKELPDAANIEVPELSTAKNEETVVTTIQEVDTETLLKDMFSSLE
ncbi:hypothetical protein GOP47_0027712 [Adiantum capillus-veneris]|nr:hypothetical protein GOP47_0027712 [Adiantum capillus-veneris]